MATKRYIYWFDEGLYREDPETQDFEGWDGEKWFAVLGTEGTTIRFNGRKITAAEANKFKVKI